MDGVGTRRARDREEALDHQIALERRGGPDRIGLIGQLHVERLAIGLREDGDGGDALLAARADDPHGNLATIGDQDLLELHSPSAFTAASTNDVSTMSVSGMVDLMKP